MTEEQIIDNFKLLLNKNKDKYLISFYYQVKTHRKKRINKKWLKRYGVKEYKRASPECFEETSKVIEQLIKIKLPTYFDNFVDVRDLKI
ncbi:MAG: hypothetical protein LLF98_02790 [Clostridium sp.]|uniref:hypothetical protein n=1 Tax=Clostridium sp. TaxID=1506 RepID=UPI0025B92CA4|nr:hypothetical protein [Clostridium sp.]MCE5220211.1 hypothetical protein [Clostridium sp.]